MTGTAGKFLTINNLPPTNIKRWTTLRKAQVVSVVHRGLIAREHACERYCISPEELLSWEHSLNKHGMRGLRATNRQDSRQPSPRTVYSKR